MKIRADLPDRRLADAKKTEKDAIFWAGIPLIYTIHFDCVTLNLHLKE